MAKSPAAVIIDTNGVLQAVADDVALPANTRGFISVGYDGTNTRFFRIDPTTGHLLVICNQLPAALVGGRLDVVVGAALPAGTNNIGDVDVLTVPAPLSTVGGGTEATALRVTIASDSTGLISVDDNGGSLTTDTPQLPAALVGDRLDINLGAWLGSEAPTVGQKAMAASVPIVVASDQTAIPVSQSGTWTVQQGTPPWAVKGTDAAGVAPTENPVLIAGSDGSAVRIVRTEDDGTVRTQDNFIDDRDKIVAVNFDKAGVAATTYYVLVDLDGVGYKHQAGTAIVAAGMAAGAIKSNSGAKWAVQLAVVLRIDGTDADLGFLPGGSVFLKDTTQFGAGGSLVLFPAVADLTVSGGAFTKIADGAREMNVAAINTGVTIANALGTMVTPAAGDLLLRATLISGTGTLDFSYGFQYWVK